MPYCHTHGFQQGKFCSECSAPLSETPSDAGDSVRVRSPDANARASNETIVQITQSNIGGLVVLMIIILLVGLLGGYLLLPSLMGSENGSPADPAIQDDATRVALAVQATVINMPTLPTPDAMATETAVAVTLATAVRGTLVAIPVTPSAVSAPTPDLAMTQEAIRSQVASAVEATLTVVSVAPTTFPQSTSTASIITPSLVNPTKSPTPTPNVYSPLDINLTPVHVGDDRSASIEAQGANRDGQNPYVQGFRIPGIPERGALLSLDTWNIRGANPIWINDAYVGSVPGFKYEEWRRNFLVYVHPSALRAGANSLEIYAGPESFYGFGPDPQEFIVRNLRLIPLDQTQLPDDLDTIVIAHEWHHIGTDREDTKEWPAPDPEGDTIVFEFSLPGNPISNALLSLQGYDVEFAVPVNINLEYVGNLPSAGGGDLSPETNLWVPRQVLVSGLNRLSIGPVNDENVMIQNIQLHVKLE